MILDTFYVLFKSNSDDLKKGAQDAEKTTDKVDKKLKEAEKSSTQLGSSFKSMIASASGAFAALFSVGAVVGGIKAAAEYADNIGRLSKNLGYSTEALDAWGGAITRAGGDAGAFYSTVEAMDKKFGRSGAFIKRLPRLADRFHGLSNVGAKKLGEALGIDQGTVMLLQKGRKEVEAFIAREKELGVVTKEQTEASRKFKVQQEDTSHAFRSLFMSYLVDILPIFEKGYKKLEEFAVLMRKHKDFIVGSIAAIATIITARLVPAVLRLTAAMLTNPAVLITAAIVALGLAFGVLYEDIQKFKKGHDSLIGRAFAKWPEFAKFVQSVGKAISYAAEKLSEFEGWLNSGGFTLNPFKMLETIITRIVAGIQAGWDLWQKFSGAILEGVEAGKFLFNLITGNNDDASNANKVANGINTFDKAALSNQNSVTNEALTKNNTNNINIGPTTINTQASDPNAITNAWNENFKRQTNFAANNLVSGRAA